MELTKLLKFHCPKCGGNELECVQTGADVNQTIQADATSGDVYYTGVPEISGDYIQIDRFQCNKCGYIIPHVNGEHEIVEWLREQPYNRPIERSLEEQKQIKAAVGAVINAGRAYAAAAYGEVVADGSLNNIVSPERLEFRRKLKDLYELIGGCDDIIKTAVGSDDV